MLLTMTVLAALCGLGVGLTLGMILQTALFMESLKEASKIQERYLDDGK